MSRVATLEIAAQWNDEKARADYDAFAQTVEGRTLTIPTTFSNTTPTVALEVIQRIEALEMELRTTAKGSDRT